MSGRAVSVVLCAVAACGGAESAPEAGDDLPCEVAVVLAERCQSCHTDPPVGGAKFPLLRYEDAAAPLGKTGKTRWQRMAEVVEPGGLPRMPYQDAAQLSQAELDTLRAWFAAGAPPAPVGEGCDAD